MGGGHIPFEAVEMMVAAVMGKQSNPLEVSGGGLRKKEEEEERIVVLRGGGEGGEGGGGVDGLLQLILPLIPLRHNRDQYLCCVAFYLSSPYWPLLIGILPPSLSTHKNSSKVSTCLYHYYYHYHYHLGVVTPQQQQH